MLLENWIQSQVNFVSIVFNISQLLKDNANKLRQLSGCCLLNWQSPSSGLNL